MTYSVITLYFIFHTYSILTLMSLGNFKYKIIVFEDYLKYKINIISKYKNVCKCLKQSGEKPKTLIIKGISEYERCVCHY